ncbi:fibroblast growth factor receptor-like 1 isoform X2 [Daphnia carinata]|uniref:fibroblast growth factor receptor-like 1 isoform X2 n=1 Tax=Daphnia carinata TaxID=120202 RepID=UPI00257E2901|nr:fibroblast growth factor receptor-like 1 isoform X2 [Daphnia carinata]
MKRMRNKTLLLQVMNKSTLAPLCVFCIILQASLSRGAAAATVASTAAIEKKTEANKSFSFSDPAGLLLAQADAPYHQQQHPQQEQLNDVATPSQMDLSTGLMGLDSANTDEHQSGPAASPGSESGPLFDPTTERNVTVLVGRTANLHCRVRYLGNRTVSWIRHRDVHILTVGRYTYASDQRFSIVKTRPSEDWTLQIKFTQARDAGLYECQISTQPHRSQFIRLNVVAPKAVILGGPEFHVDVGSHVNLTCIVQYSPEPPEYVFWHHHDQELRHDSSRGGVAIVTDKTNQVTSTSLLLRQVRLSDSGKYSCTPSNADPASVTLHVLQGERPAAMQSNAGVSSHSIRSILLFLPLGFVWLDYRLVAWVT